MEENRALLVMDVQDPLINALADREGFLQQVQLAVDTAHKSNILIIYAVMGFRPGTPEFNSRSKGLRALDDAGVVSALINPTPVLALTETDIVVRRSRISAFTGSDLEVILRSKNISHLILTGISTSGVVLSTLREAVDKDYILTVLSDLCADRDEEVHHILTERVFPRHAEVMSSTEWLNEL